MRDGNAGTDEGWATRLTMPLGEALFTQRAIRRFRPDPIPDADLRDLLLAATRAPSGTNAQSWHFLLLRDREVIRALGALYREAWWAKRRARGMRSPEDIPADDHVGQSAMRLADEMGSVPAIVVICATAPGAGAVGSVIPAAQNLLLAARALGIGGTITTLHPDVDDRARALLGMQEDAQIVYCVPLGYPRGRFGPAQRRSLSAVTSLDRWGQPLVG